MPWTYILTCTDGSFYTGSTNIDLEARVWEHNNDDEFGANFTRKRRPVTLSYAEEFDTIDAAFAREKQIQGWSRAKKEALMAGRSEALVDLSRSSSGALRQTQRPSTAGCARSPPWVPELVEGPYALECFT